MCIICMRFCGRFVSGARTIDKSASSASMVTTLANYPHRFYHSFNVRNKYTILQEVGAILMTGPFGQVVVYVDNPQAVKNVAGWFE